MFWKCQVVRLSLAVALSAAVVVVSVVLQGALLFRQELEKLRRPEKTVIHRLTLTSDGQQASVLLRFPHDSLIAPSHAIGVCDFLGKACSLRIWPLSFDPFNAVGTRSGSRLFVSSNRGEIHVLDLDSPTLSSRVLGTHDGGGLHMMAASRDGSLLVTSNRSFTMGWIGEPPKRLWRRDDFDVTSVCICADTSRVYCGLLDGRVCELEGRSGATLSTFEAHSTYPVSMDVSNDGKYLSALDGKGLLIVSDLTTGQFLWRTQLPTPAAGPRFSPGGAAVLTPSETRKPEVVLRSIESGQRLATFQGAKAEIAGIDVSDHGDVVAWDIAGAVTVWDLSSGALLRQYSIECPLPNSHSL